jgi:putative SOS response-associated peptidase YedK
MCGRYVRRGSAETINKWFDIEPEDLPILSPSYNVCPQSTQPVVRWNSKTAGRELKLMRWGLIPYWAKEARIGLGTINAKAETVATNALFREAFRRRRCLVPADLFYEWQKLDAKTKQPYALGLANGNPYAFAGLWDSWRDTTTGQSLETYTIITTDPNELTGSIHDRMPVILDPMDYKRWLEPAEPSHLPVDLLRPYPGEKMAAWKVDAAVGNSRNDHCGLINPI